MTREFSSSLTLVYKIAYPVLWAVGSGSAGVMLYLHPDRVKYNGVMGAAPAWLAYQGLAMSGAGTAFILWYFRRFKYVGIEDGELVVSNYWKDWRVPFSMIDDASQTRFMNPPHITITLREDVGFGREVVYMPKQPATISVSGLGMSYTLPAQATHELEDFRQAVGLVR
jgi:hypothetical protein